MPVVGLTGGIGAGKSTVAARLAERGAEVIDVDAVGKQVIEVGGRAHGALLAEFGAAVLGDDGRLDRAALASQVFGDPERLAALTAISHPAINAELAELVGASDAQVVVLDMAILVESNLGEGLYDTVVVVEAPVDVRLARLAERGMAEDDARARMANQATDEERRAVADHVLVNDGDLIALRSTVDHLWRALR